MAMPRKPKITIASKGTKLAAALSRVAAAAPVASSPMPPDAATGPAPGVDAEPPMPPVGATDGLGMGQGGLAIHPSLKAHNIGGYESRHTSKTR